MMPARSPSRSIVVIGAASGAIDARLAAEVERVLAGGHFPLVVGGDHSCAIGTWSGVHCVLAGRGPIGLIWIDAHMDSHTFATTPSGQIHGMALAAALARLRDDAAFVAMEVVEYNPRRDHGHVTADAAGALVDAIAPAKPTVR